MVYLQDFEVCARQRAAGGVQPVGDRACQWARGHAQQVPLIKVVDHANIFILLCRVMTKDNIALAALLQTKEACWEGGVPPDHKVFEYLYLRPQIISSPSSICLLHEQIWA